MMGACRQWPYMEGMLWLVLGGWGSKNVLIDGSPDRWYCQNLTIHGTRSNTCTPVAWSFSYPHHMFEVWFKGKIVHWWEWWIFESGKLSWRLFLRLLPEYKTKEWGWEEEYACDHHSFSRPADMANITFTYSLIRYFGGIANGNDGSCQWKCMHVFHPWSWLKGGEQTSWKWESIYCLCQGKALSCSLDCICVPQKFGGWRWQQWLRTANMGGCGGWKRLTEVGQWLLSYSSFNVHCGQCSSQQFCHKVIICREYVTTNGFNKIMVF